MVHWSLECVQTILYRKNRRGEKRLGILSSNICQSTVIPHFFDRQISSDLHRSPRVPDRGMGEGQAAPFASPPPVATPMLKLPGAKL